MLCDESVTWFLSLPSFLPIPSPTLPHPSPAHRLQSSLLCHSPPLHLFLHLFQFQFIFFSVISAISHPHMSYSTRFASFTFPARRGDSSKEGASCKCSNMSLSDTNQMPVPSTAIYILPKLNCVAFLYFHLFGPTLAKQINLWFR